jgi:transcription termination factor Rho
VSVLQRSELEASPLADLHAIASELGIEGYRAMRRDDLVGAVLQAQGGEDEPEPAGDPEPAPDREGADEVVPRPRRRGRRRSKKDDPAEKPPADEKPEAEKQPDPDEDDQHDSDDAEPVDDDSGGDGEEELAAGVLDILPNGSGFVRVGEGNQSPGDVYISPAQIRRCELRAGDEVAGPVRAPRRNERHPSMVRVATVNGRDAEPPEERPLFDDMTPVHPTKAFKAPKALSKVPFGRGSRVAIAGGPGAGATRLLREIVSSLAGEKDLAVTVALVGARPEEVTEWHRDSGVPVTGGSFDSSLEAQTQAAELAVERAKRAAERGGHAVVVLDSLESLPSGAARRIFGAARATEDGGSLTVIAATGHAWEPQRQASTRVALEAPDDKGELQLSQSRSGTLRVDLLA